MTKFSLFHVPNMIWLFVSLLVIAAATGVLGQNNEGNTNRFVYVRDMPSGEKQIVLLVNEEEHEVLLSDSDCYSLDRGLIYIAVSQRENPTHIRIVQLETGDVLTSIPWQPEWVSPCAFGFRPQVEGQPLLVVVINSSSQQTTLLEIATGNVVAQTNIEEPDGAFALNAQSNSFSSDELPGILPQNPQYLVSPDGVHVLYERCLREDLNTLPTFVPVSCLGQEAYVVYDLTRHQDIAILNNPIYVDVPLALAYIWSPSGRYLAYQATSPLSNDVSIFDVTQNAYVDTAAIQVGDYDVATFKWSADEQKLAVLLFTPSQDALDARALSVFDLVTGEYTILPEEFDLRADNWGWYNADSLLVTQNDGTLLQLTLDGIVTMIADNVEAIYGDTVR